MPGNQRCRFDIIAKDLRAARQQITNKVYGQKVCDMERSSKRGKIPQEDRPSIIKRYEAGETLASIARTYDCSPPAISYIVSRSRARDATVEGAAPDATGPSEPQLVKGRGHEMPVAEVSPGSSDVEETVAGDVEMETSNAIEELRTEPRPIAMGLALNELANSPDLPKDSITRQSDAATKRHDQEEGDPAAPHDANTTR